MSASDKSRFYLEQNVPELREWERRGVFDQTELSSIKTRRSTFENRIHSHGSASPEVFAQYIAFETNLATLAQKRAKRLRLETSHESSSKKTGFKSLKELKHGADLRLLRLHDRAVQKHKGHLGLWLQYLEYARQTASNKRQKQIMTEALRFFPTEPELWIRAARDAEQREGLNEARGMLRRGLRLCGPRAGVRGRSADASRLYLEWTRLELRWLRQIEGRRKVLGLDSKRNAQSKNDIPSQNEEEQEAPKLSEQEEDIGTDAPKSLPAADYGGPNVGSMTTTPVLAGDIPVAIFETAIRDCDNQDRLIAAFVEIYEAFSSLSCSRRLIQRAIEAWLERNRTSPLAWSYKCKAPLMGVDHSSLTFVTAVRASLKEIKQTLELDEATRRDCAGHLLEWLQPLRADDTLPPELHQVLDATVSRVSKVASAGEMSIQAA